MDLAPAVEHGGDQGNSDTTPDVAGQVHQTRRGVVLISRQESVGSGVNRYEEKCHARSLEDASRSRSAEIDRQVKTRHVKQRSREHDETENQQPARAVTGEQKS